MIRLHLARNEKTQGSEKNPSDLRWDFEENGGTYNNDEDEEDDDDDDDVDCYCGD